MGWRRLVIVANYRWVYSQIIPELDVSHQAIETGLATLSPQSGGRNSGCSIDTLIVPQLDATLASSVTFRNGILGVRSGAGAAEAGPGARLFGAYAVKRCAHPCCRLDNPLVIRFKTAVTLSGMAVHTARGMRSSLRRGLARADASARGVYEAAGEVPVGGTQRERWERVDGGGRRARVVVKRGSS